MPAMDFSAQASLPVRFALEHLPADAGLQLHLAFDPEVPAQGYTRRIAGQDCTLAASDEAGMMYGILDLAEALKQHRPVQDATFQPYIDNRGIKFNIPLDARTPSYTDASTSATRNIPVMWEKEFWHTFLDRMAEQKYNVLSLWTLSPFPSLVRIPEYPRACLDDVKITTKPFHALLSGKGIYDDDHAQSLITVKRMTIDEKISFWREVMDYAAERCIRVFIFTWNVFVYGTEDSGYGLTDDLNNPVTRDYIYCGTKALMETYPRLAGIGVTSGENMRFTDANPEASCLDIEYIRNTYGRGIDDYMTAHPERDFTLIHRMQMARYDQIMQYYDDFKARFEISFKYSQAHMYSSTRPMFIKDFLQEKAPEVKVWLTVRNDDYYMLRWGDPDFAREYLRNMPVDCMAGFYMGADGFTWGRDFMTVNDDRHPLFIDKMWYMFSIWGQLAYCPDKPDESFTASLASRFGLSGSDAAKLQACWADASRLVPAFNCTHWHDFDFQWYPEGCCMYLSAPDRDKIVFADINEFVSCRAMPDAGYASVAEYARAAAAGQSVQGISPVEVIQGMQACVARSEAALPALRALSDQEEYQRTLDDIHAMNLLGHYFAVKEQAAVQLALFRQTRDEHCQAEAVALLKQAAVIWKQYSAWIKQRYYPQVLTRLCGKVDLQDFDELADLDVLLAAEG